MIKVFDKLISGIGCLLIRKLHIAHKIPYKLLHITSVHRLIYRQEYELNSHILEVYIHISLIQYNLSNGQIIRLEIHELICNTEYQINQLILVYLLLKELIHGSHGWNRICQSSLTIYIFLMAERIIAHKLSIVQLYLIVKNLYIVFNLKVQFVLITQIHLITHIKPSDIYRTISM